MTKSHNKPNIYKVRFKAKEDAKVTEVTVRYVTSSEIMGCIALENFIFREQSKHLIVPKDEDLAKKYHGVKKLHVPFHNLLIFDH